ncbi:hypothetical protein Salat_2737300 [Sesamum alatum]|uniref:Uncharacterized protein n=1 Tax=Sesamum alatum TaxID=300844 RepID=A0AAE1XKT5_9LAMI|nr:hypothetical protein Salat_2737300 [Sesamum alatum]
MASNSRRQQILELCFEHETDREVDVYLEGEIGGEVEINEKVASDFLDSDYELGREDEEAEAAEIEQAVQEAEALFFVNVQETEVNMDLSMQVSLETEITMDHSQKMTARKRTMTPTGSGTEVYLGSQNTNPGKRPKTSQTTFKTQQLRRSTRLNATVASQENATSSKATFKPPRPAHPQIVPPPFKTFQKEGKKYVTTNNLTAALNVRRAGNLSKRQSSNKG